MLRLFLSVPAIILITACDLAPIESAQSEPAPIISSQSLPIAPAYMWPAGQEHFAKRVLDIQAQTPMIGGVLFIGDSITEGADWKALFPNIDSRNHGVSWDTATGVINRMAQIGQHKPDKIFLLIGTNDTNYQDRTPNMIADEIGTAVTQLRAKNPKAEIYVQSVMPRSDELLRRVQAVNTSLSTSKKLRAAKARYVDLTDGFATSRGTLRPELTYDGLHLNDAGYTAWAKIIEDNMK